MLKSDLQIEPYTLNEALICLNKELKKINRTQLKLQSFRDLVYTKVKVTIIKKPKLGALIEYNSIVDIYNYMTTKRYPASRKSRIKSISND